jgi:hypothetical protein
VVLHHHWSLIAALLVVVLGSVVSGGGVHVLLALVHLTEALVLTLPIAWHIEMTIIHH